MPSALQRRQHERDGVSNHRRLDCLLNRLFRRTSKKTSKLHVTGLCEGNSPVTGEFPHKAQQRGKCFHLMTASWIEVEKSWELAVHARGAIGRSKLNTKCGRSPRFGRPSRSYDTGCLQNSLVAWRLRCLSRPGAHTSHHHELVIGWGHLSPN